MTEVILDVLRAAIRYTAHQRILQLESSPTRYVPWAPHLETYHTRVTRWRLEVAASQATIPKGAGLETSAQLLLRCLP